MADEEAPPRTIAGGIAAPLQTPVFRRIWLASLFSNMGLLIQAVGAAWAMTQLTAAADMIALVQTALMLPIMLWSMPAGAIADMYDQRKVALLALSVSLVGASLLTAITYAGLLTPWILLAFCFVLGSGMALFAPAWAASVREQVPPVVLPQAVALNSISYNIARSFGPAIGGVIVAAAGAVAAFATNALCYLPLLIVMLAWRRVAAPSRLPPERLDRAVSVGVRYIINSPALRVVLWRTLLTGVAGSSVSALMPIVARELLGGGAQTYGIILGAFGIGAVLGALNIAKVRARFEAERTVVVCALVMGTAIATVALSRFVPLTVLALAAAGAAWMISVTCFNIAVQVSAPRWVSGRTLAGYQAAIAGGIAFGSWVWGHVAQGWGVSVALIASAAAMTAVAAVGRWLRMPAPVRGDPETVKRGDPEVALALTGRSGPIVVEIEYRVDPQDARPFYQAIQKVQRVRQRNGGYGWSIARDIADPALWTERFHCPTWHDYLRMRERSTVAEARLADDVFAFHSGEQPVRVRRMLDRPFGSVRWRADAPDTGPQPGEVPVAPTSLGVT